jgi:SAM-dependent methyltransferase
MTDKTKEVISPKTYWERVAETKWGGYISRIEHKWILHAAKMFSERGVFLEVGCEGGRWSEMLSRLGWRAVCTDINPKSLELCQARVPDARCHLAGEDDNRLPCDDNSLELVLCVEVVPVILSDWFLPEAYRVLRKNGIVVGVFNNRRSLRGWLMHQINYRRGKFDWYAGDYLKWKQQAAAHGFRVISQEGLCWFPFGRGSNSAFVSFFTGLEKSLGLRKMVNISPWVVFLLQKP